MQTQFNNTPTAAIQLNETFFRLATGAATISAVLSERAAARAAMIVKEDPYLRRRRLVAELADPFTMNYCH